MARILKVTDTTGVLYPLKDGVYRSGGKRLSREKRELRAKKSASHMYTKIKRRDAGWKTTLKEEVRHNGTSVLGGGKTKKSGPWREFQKKGRARRTAEAWK